MATQQSLVLDLVRLDHVWVGKPRGESDRLFISRPGRSGISGGEYIGQIAVWYPWMEDQPELIAPQVKIHLIQIQTADGRKQTVADQELVFLDRQGRTKRLFPIEAVFGDLHLNYRQLMEALRPHLGRKTSSVPFALPRVPLQWNTMRQVLTDGYISLPADLSLELSQVPPAAAPLVKLSNNSSEWQGWLYRLEGKTWSEAKETIEQACTSVSCSWRKRRNCVR